MADAIPKGKKELDRMMWEYIRERLGIQPKRSIQGWKMFYTSRAGKKYADQKKKLMEQFWAQVLSDHLEMGEYRERLLQHPASHPGSPIPDSGMRGSEVEEQKHYQEAPEEMDGNGGG